MTIDTDRLRALADKATPGPWMAQAGSDGWGLVCGPDRGGIDVGGAIAWLPDAEYIAALDPDTVRALLDAAELGLAWQRAEAALPEGWLLYGVTRSNLGMKQDWRAAYADPAAWFNFYGPTPAAALNALADALEARSAG